MFSDELNALQGKLQFIGDIDESRWLRIFHGMSPTALYEHFQNIRGANAQAVLTINASNPQSVILTITHHDDSETLPGQERYLRYRIEPQEVEIITAQFAGSKAGEHLVSQYKNRMNEILLSWGINELSVRTHEVGGYSWAKEGFKIHPQDWNDTLAPSIRQRAAGDKVIYKGIAYPLLPNEAHDIDAILSQYLPDDPLGAILKLDRVIGRVDGYDLTVAKALLLDQEWRGKMLLGKDSREQNAASFIE